MSYETCVILSRIVLVIMLIYGGICMLDKLFDYFKEKRKLASRFEILEDRIQSIKYEYDLSAQTFEKNFEDLENTFASYRASVQEYMLEADSHIESIVQKVYDIDFYYQLLSDEITLLDDYFSDRQSPETNEKLKATLNQSIDTIKKINEEMTQFHLKRQVLLDRKELEELRREHQIQLDALRYRKLNS